MNQKQIKKVFQDTAFVRMGGSEQELKTANYFVDFLKGYGLDAHIEDFEVPMATIKKASLLVDGKQITCKGYFNCGSADLTAPLYYLTGNDEFALSNCKGKIVLLDGYVRCWLYRDLVKHGALGIITYDGNVHYTDNDVEQRELRSYFVEEVKLPCVSINVKDAIKMVENSAKEAHIVIEQDEYMGNSQNVVLSLPGERTELITFTAHYDSTSLSHGAYDNMSGSVGLLQLATHFLTHKHGYSMKFVWCGSEERGLLGSKAYCEAHKEELENTVLNVNLDMVGCTMGKFIACCTSEKALVNYISYLGKEIGFSVRAYQDVYSSDSTPFADNGIPAVSFARIAPKETATIHNSHDTAKIISASQMQKDVEFITAFTTRMANAAVMPVAKEMPGNMKEKLDEYLLRKRPE